MPTNPAWVEHTEKAAWDTVAALRAEIARDRQHLERLIAIEPSLPKLAALLDEAKREHALERDGAAAILEELIALLGNVKRERDALRDEIERLGQRAPSPTVSDDAVILVEDVSKTYASGHQALRNVNLAVRRREIFALLGPNGAGKTTLIAIICGLVNASSGRVLVNGHDIVESFREARSAIGLVPQELATDMFETVWATVTFSRGLFGLPPHPGHIEKVLRDLSLWDKRQSKIAELSGGMKRRVLIAKALSHEPTILFLDEPTAGVDVELRRDMWRMVRDLRSSGVTIILTTHYIEEAEEMADRIGVVHEGELILVEEKAALMEKLGKKQLRLVLKEPLEGVPETLIAYALELAAGGRELVYTFVEGQRAKIPSLLRDLVQLGIDIEDVQTRESSLEEIFVTLVSGRR